MQVAMLGPLEVRDSAGAVLGVGGARLRGLLIMLALRPGQLVTSSQLIEGLWGEQPPAEPGNALQALVSRLRRAVPEAEIESRAAGYRLVLDPEATDVARFERLAAAGHTRLRDDPAQAAKVLREALALWRGPALADAAETEGAGGTGVQAVVARLDELRLGATQDRVTADLQLGRAREVIAELEGLTAAYPTREPLAGLLMRALRASGQRNAALEVYERTRRRLADQLGTDPSAELAALHLELLQAEQPAPASRLELPESGRPAPASAGLESRSFAACIAGDLARLDGQIGIAREHLQLARELADVPDMAAQQRAVVSTALAFVASAEGDSDTARRLHEEAYQLALPTSDAPVIARALIGLADQALRDGDHGRASGLLTESISVRGSTDRSDVDEQRLCAALEGAYGERREDGGYGHRVQE